MEVELPESRQSIAELSERDWVEWRRLTREVRRILDRAAALDAKAEIVAELADRAEALARDLEPHAGPQPLSHLVERGQGPIAAETLNEMLPFSPITGRLNPISPPLQIRGEGDRVIGEVRLGSPYQGAPGFAHGAIVAGIWDEVLAFAGVSQGVMGPTAYLNIHYRKPTLLHVDLRFESRVDRVEGRKVFAVGVCYAGDEIVSEADAMYIHIDPDDPHPDWDHHRRIKASANG